MSRIGYINQVIAISKWLLHRVVKTQIHILNIVLDNKTLTGDFPGG
jgi:hypothetical protein